LSPDQCVRSPEFELRRRGPANGPANASARVTSNWVRRAAIARTRRLPIGGATEPGCGHPRVPRGRVAWISRWTRAGSSG